MTARRGFLAACLSALLAPAPAWAVTQLRNLTIEPQFVCPGQAVTLRFQQMYSTNNGNFTWGVISTNNATWQDANDYFFMDSTHPNNGTAASTPGAPAALQIALAGGLPNGFWHSYTFVTNIPAGLTGTNATFIIRGNDGAANWVAAAPFQAEISVTAEITCTKKAVTNRATLWEQEASAVLVIEQCAGTPTNTPSRTATRTSTPTPSATPTRTPTVTPSDTPTQTPTRTPSPTPSDSPTRSFTPTDSPTRTETRTATPTPTNSFTASPPFTATHTPTRTESFTPSDTPTQTVTFTSTATRTATPTASPSFTESYTPTQTSTRSATPSHTPTVTETLVFSPTNTPTLTATPSVTPSFTDTWTRTATPSATPTATQTVTFTETATRTASPTPSPSFTDSPTRTISPTITQTPIPVPYRVSVTVYNSAGERVRLLFDGSAAVLPTSLDLDRSVIRSGLDTVNLNLYGALSNGSTFVSWQGQNDSGQSIRGGVYYMKIEYRDPFGATTSFTKSVQVLEGKAGNRIDIYNSAGELVYRADFRGLTQTVTAFTLSKSAMVAAYLADGTAQDGIQGSLTFSDGSVQAISWDGRSADGRPLNSGTYTAVLTSETQQGTLISSKAITLTRGQDAGLSREPVLGPNPAPAQGHPVWGRNLRISYPPTELIQPVATLYNQAGERISAASDSASTGFILLSYEKISGGIYLVEVQGRLASGAPYRKVLKAAVLR